MKPLLQPILASASLFLCACGPLTLSHASGVEPLSGIGAAPINGRTDTELSESYGTCLLADFRHHSWLTAQSWNSLAWQSTGCLSAANDSKYRHSLGPEYRLKLELLIDGKPRDIVPATITQQFDCRTLAGAADQISFARMDMMLASLQWASAWKCRNTTKRDLPVEYKVTFSDDRNLPKSLVKTAGHYLIAQDDFISHLVAFDSKPEISVKDKIITLSWKRTLAPQKDFAVCLGFRSGWGKAEVDKSKPGPMNFNICAKLVPAELAQVYEEEFTACARLLKEPKARLDWSGLSKLAAAKQELLRDTMPRLTGFPASWEGAFDYALDLLRVGTKMPQGQCQDIWLTADPMFYVWTFYWDTALSAHSYCNLDPAAAARTLLTFLRGGIQPDGHAWIQFNPVAHYPNDRPQLMNIPMALWDCYQISRNKEIIAQAYPILARHQNWIDRVWNQRPNGPIADLDWNIDYGSVLDQERHVWVDMTVFQVSQYEYLAKMAELLGQPPPTAALWRAKASQLKNAVNKYMWNEKDGAYYCLKARTLEQTRVSCPIEFYTLTTGVASPEAARKLMKRLFDPAKYAPGARGKFFCPSVAYDDPTFKIMADGFGGWGGNIWLVEPYYTVRGLARYGLQDEAFAVTTNLFKMAADEFARTGSIWEQYNPATGHGIHLKYFTSGITTSLVDMLLRGVFGFERTDDPHAFFLTPTPVVADWHGIDNLPLTASLRLSFTMKKGPATQTVCRIHFTGQTAPLRTLEVFRFDTGAGAEEPCARAALGRGGVAEITLDKIEGRRYLWKIR